MVFPVGKCTVLLYLKINSSSYRSITPKARLLPLTTPFVEYLRSDGIVLPSEDEDYQTNTTDTDSGIFSTASSDVGSDSEDEEQVDPTFAWPEIHKRIKSIIAELGGNIVPKLNWSAPKDATWISATNSMECRTPNDIYLLLKSSDFITHDLEQAFDDCEDDSKLGSDLTGSSESINHGVASPIDVTPPLQVYDIPFHLILRKTITALVTSLEFRCFVRSRQLLCVCQRDLNHYSFLPGMLPTLRLLTQSFFDTNLKKTFPDDSFVFDVYIPPPHTKVWLVDINPWAPRTDPLLFSWLEILDMNDEGQTVALRNVDDALEQGKEGREAEQEWEEDVNESKDEDYEEDLPYVPEFRLVNRDDPEAYSFNTPQYSAHKLPRDIVDAGGNGQAGLTEFMGQWREIVKSQEEDESAATSKP